MPQDLNHSVQTVAVSPTVRGHVGIMRLDHWVKNVFVLPGILVALTVAPSALTPGLVASIILGLLAVGLVASSNYVINEVLDAPFDREHPTKCGRPVASGEVSTPLAVMQWLALMALGVGLGFAINMQLGVTLLVFWTMGCAYNFPPVRTKDRPYLDVLWEAINNPLRMLAGWYLITPDLIAPLTLLLSYWMAGAYFMALKRFAEFRDIGDASRAARYRRSFGYYTEVRLLISIMFYASAAMLFLGAFIMRYRLEMIIAFPMLALVMAFYLSLAFKSDSAVQAPEKLYKEPLLMGAVVVTAIALVSLLFIDIPLLHHLFEPTIPTNVVSR